MKTLDEVLYQERKERFEAAAEVVLDKFHEFDGEASEFTAWLTGYFFTVMDDERKATKEVILEKMNEAISEAFR